MVKEMGSLILGCIRGSVIGSFVASRMIRFAIRMVIAAFRSAPMREVQPSAIAAFLAMTAHDVRIEIPAPTTTVGASGRPDVLVGSLGEHAPPGAFQAV